MQITISVLATQRDVRERCMQNVGCMESINLEGNWLGPTYHASRKYGAPNYMETISLLVIEIEREREVNKLRRCKRQVFF